MSIRIFGHFVCWNILSTWNGTWHIVGVQEIFGKWMNKGPIHQVSRVANLKLLQVIFDRGREPELEILNTFSERALSYTSSTPVDKFFIGLLKFPTKASSLYWKTSILTFQAYFLISKAVCVSFSKNKNTRVSDLKKMACFLPLFYRGESWALNPVSSSVLSLSSSI